jgi:hypothetical protein
MSVWQALFWGGFSSAALYIGKALAGPMGRAYRATGLVMGFGAGTLLSAVAYELLPESSLKQGLGIGIGFGLGALAYYVGDRLIDRGGGGDRQQISGAALGGSGAAMFLGALLDGLPEAFILGITLALGGRSAWRSSLRCSSPTSPGHRRHGQPEGGRLWRSSGVLDVDGAHRRLCSGGRAGLCAGGRGAGSGAMLTKPADSDHPRHTGSNAGLLARQPAGDRRPEPLPVLAAPHRRPAG